MSRRAFIPISRFLLAITLAALLLGALGCRGRGLWPGRRPSVIDIEPVPVDPPPAMRPDQLGDAQDLETETRIGPAGRPVNPDQTTPVSELRTVYFPYDSSTITSEMRQVLEQNAEWIKRNGGFTIQIEGHCDERGSTEYNFNLGQRRADAVREELYRLGVDPNMLMTVSYGEERPVALGHGEEDWAKNRRAQFFIY